MSAKKLFVLFFAAAFLLSGCNAIATLETQFPTPAPTGTTAPTLPPVITATSAPTQAPTAAPTEAPTAAPTEAPTATAVAGAIAHLASGSSVTVTQVHMLTTTGWAVGMNLSLDPANEHILRTIDGGYTWQDVTPPQQAAAGTNGGNSPAQQAAAFFLDGKHAWVGFAPPPGPGNGVSNDAIWYTTDGGQSWQASAALNKGQGGAEFFSPGTITFLPDGKNGWLLVHAGVGMNHDYVYVYNTTDGGVTWNLQVDPMDINKGNIMSCYKSGLSFVNATTGWLAGSCNGVKAGVLLFQSKDAGSTWSEVTLSAPPQAPGIFTAQDQSCGSLPPAFVSESDGFMQVTCQSFGATQASQTWIYATTDGGATWTPHPAPAAQGSCQFIDALTGWFVGGNEVYRSTDGGKTWTKMTQHVDWSAQLSFLDATTGFGVAVAGQQPNLEYGLVYTINGGATWALLKPKIK
jgi:photosystem II stability/assembly factor-like uncharacterized protein